MSDFEYERVLSPEDQGKLEDMARVALMARGHSEASLMRQQVRIEAQMMFVEGIRWSAAGALDGSAYFSNMLRSLARKQAGKFVDYTKEYGEGPGGDYSFDHGFGWAIAMLKEGKRLARKGWNGKDMFIYYVPGSTFKVNRPPLLGIYDEGTSIDYHGHIDMKTAQGYCVPWLASQADMLDEDWALYR